MNKNALVALVVVVLVIIGAVLISWTVKNRQLSTGKVTQNQPEMSPLPGSEALKTRPQVSISTSKGDFTIELRPDIAPKTVANFLSKFSLGYCNNLTWHRVEDWVVQGCDPAGNGTGGLSNLPTETSGEPFVAGSIGVARQASPKEISNDSQFFIVKTDSTFLNGEYTYFGKVIAGLDTVNKLAIGDKIISTLILSK